MAQPGMVLSRWGDSGWGKMVADDKHAGKFRQQLVEAMADMICTQWKLEDYPTWITCVPSNRRPSLVTDFTERLSKILGIPFLNVLNKIKDIEAQKNQQNGYFQCRNLYGAFDLTCDIPGGAVFLIDDTVDSRWTFTIAAALLREKGSGLVYPVALASTGHN